MENQNLDNSKIRYLHLSDLRFKGSTEQDGLFWPHDNHRKMKLESQDNSRISLKKILAEITAENALDFVLITGDIARSGTGSEYSQALEFLAQNLSTDNKFIPTYIVPGPRDMVQVQNEDSNENRYDFDDDITLNRIINNPELMLEKRNEFSHFYKFTDNFKYTNSDPYLLNFTENIKLNKADKDIFINIIGLNSSLFHGNSYGKDKQQRLALGPELVKESFEKMNKDADLTIALFHHDYNSLHHADRESLSYIINNACIIHSSFNNDIYGISDSAFLDFVIPSIPVVKSGLLEASDGKHYNFSIVEINTTSRLGEVRPFLCGEMNTEGFFPANPFEIELKANSKKPEQIRITPEPSSLTHIEADDIKGEDQLELDNEINAFASILAAKDTKLPLAIGLFGDWGMGKSFFMEKLIQRITKIAGEVKKSKKNEIAYYENIVQIEFNAWHYMEADLWASLVNHIFENLYIATSDDKSKDQQLRDKLLIRLDGKLRKQKETQREIEEKQNEVDNLNQSSKRKSEKLKNILIDDEVGPLLRAAGKVLGNDRLINISEDIIPVLDDLVKNSGRVVGILRVLLKSLQENKLLYAIGIVLTILSVMVWNYLDIGVFIRSVPLLVLNSPILAWVIKNFKKVLKAVPLLENAYRITTEKMVNLEDPQYSSIEDVHKDLTEIDEQIRCIEKELKDLEPQSLLKEFIKERISTDDYRKNLGILSQIREDFKRVDDLMKEQKSEKSYDPNLPSIDRIILYIDDLDRCPPKRVVAVLQAIHLLLALPLFAVVVGVDTRWVTKSLVTQYRNLLVEPGQNRTIKGKKEIGASVQNYLEKIFQIPFRLRPMDSKGARNLIDDLIGKEKTQQSKPEPAIPEPKEEPLPTEADEPKEEPEKITKKVINGFRQAVSELRSGVTVLSGSNDEKLEHDPVVDLNPKTLELSDKERKMMKSLTGIIGHSPRQVKRFVNVYRIIKTSDPETQKNSFDEGVHENGEGDFEAILLLLAVVSGFPDDAGDFFNEVDGMFKRGEKNFTGSWYAPQSTKCPDPSDLMIAIRKIFSNPEIPEKEGDYRLPGCYLKIKTLHKWIPIVKRFSFRKYDQGTPPKDPIAEYPVEYNLENSDIHVRVDRKID